MLLYTTSCCFVFTCIPLCPPYKTKDRILCNRLIFENRCFRSIEAHTPTIALRLGLNFRVRVHDCKMLRRTGAFTSSSLRSLSHVKPFMSSTDWLCKTEAVLSAHMAASSDRSIHPTFSKMYLRVTGSFMDSFATAFLLPLATALPMTQCHIHTKYFC